MLKIKILTFGLTLLTSTIYAMFGQDCADKTAHLPIAEADTTPLNAIYINAMNRLVTDSALRFGQVGVTIIDVATGQTLAAQNAAMSLIPASNMKIVSTAAGLKILGNDFQFKTELQYDGDIRDSILYGNLFIKGSGDPTLASPLMESVPSMISTLNSFADEIQKLGIKKIVGKVIGDGSAFEPNTAVSTWQWDDLGSDYGVGPSGLSFHENQYNLTFQQNTNAGMAPSVSSIEPYIPNFQLVNEVKSMSGGNESVIFAAPYSSVGYLRGTISTGSGKTTIQGALPDPPLFAAWHLRKTLSERGIEVTDSATTQLLLEQKTPTFLMRKTFFTWLSPKLSEIVRKANTESVNLYCEAIVRAVGVKQSGVGSNDEGTKSTLRFWQTKGVDTEGLFMQDGSGLSPRSGISATQLVTMLRAIALDSTWFSTFYTSLPEPKTGTMKGMFKSTPSVYGRLRAKSGTITRVKSYSGYVRTLDGRLLAFSAICNNFTCSQRDIRKKLEQFMVDICEN